MNLFFKLLAALSRHGSLPVVALIAGWYGGAKLGAPDFVMNSVDSVVAQGGDMIGGLLSGGKGDEAPADSE